MSCVCELHSFPGLTFCCFSSSGLADLTNKPSLFQILFLLIVPFVFTAALFSTDMLYNITNTFYQLTQREIWSGSRGSCALHSQSI